MRPEVPAEHLPAKKPYVCPKLLTHGSVEKLTEHHHERDSHEHGSPGSSLPRAAFWH